MIARRPFGLPGFPAPPRSVVGRAGILAPLAQPRASVAAPFRAPSFAPFTAAPLARVGRSPLRTLPSLSPVATGGGSLYDFDPAAPVQTWEPTPAPSPPPPMEFDFDDAPAAAPSPALAAENALDDLEAAPPPARLATPPAAVQTRSAVSVDIPDGVWLGGLLIVAGLAALKVWQGSSR